LNVDYAELDFENDNSEGKNEINDEIFTAIEYETHGSLSYEAPENEIDVETDKITCCDEENEIDNNYNKTNKQNEEESRKINTKGYIAMITLGIGLVCYLIVSCFMHLKKHIIYSSLLVFGYSIIIIEILLKVVILI